MHGGRPLFEIARQPRFIAAALCGVIAYPMMNLVMTSAPLAMKMCGLTVSDSNFGIQWHIVAMYGPSFFTGSLIARFGAPRIVALGLLLEAAAAAIGLSGITAMHFWATLIVLGVGWNFAFIGASALVLETHRPQERNKVQAFNDFLVFGMMALGLVLVRPVAGALRLVDGQHGGVPAGAARPCGVVVCVIRQAAREIAGGRRNSRSEYLGLSTLIAGGPMPTRARLDEFIAAVVSGDHAGAIERYYTEDASMQENAAPPRVGRDVWWRMSARCWSGSRA